MAHFAHIDSNGNVLAVYKVDNSVISDENGQEQEQIGIEFMRGLIGMSEEIVQTSYNSNFRYNFATIGGKYDKEADAFYLQKPYPSWILNTQTYIWEAPIPYPGDAIEGHPKYVWDEDTLSWVDRVEE